MRSHSDRGDSLRERAIRGNSETRSRTPVIEVRLPSGWLRYNPDMIDWQHPFWARSWISPSEGRSVERALPDDGKECCWLSRCSMNEDSKRPSRHRAAREPWRDVANPWRFARWVVEQQEDSESNHLVRRGKDACWKIVRKCRSFDHVGYCSIL